MSAINCKFPMIAIAQLEHAGVQYAPEAPFDAETEDAYDFHILHGSAKAVTAVIAEEVPPTPEKLAQPTKRK